MMRLLGKKKVANSQAPSLQDAVSTIDSRIAVLDKKITETDKELRVFKEKMKQMSSRKPAVKKQLQQRAMEVLKRKRMYEHQRENIINQQCNIEQTKFQIESAQVTMSTASAMMAARNNLRSTMHRDLDVNDIHDLTDGMAELMEDLDEVNFALGQNNFSTPHYIDEADLDAELDMLGLDSEFADEEEERVHSHTRPSYLLPSQPNSKPVGSNPHARIPVRY